MLAGRTGRYRGKGSLIATRNCGFWMSSTFLGLRKRMRLGLTTKAEVPFPSRRMHLLASGHFS